MAAGRGLQGYGPRRARPHSGALNPRSYRLNLAMMPLSWTQDISTLTRLKGVKLFNLFQHLNIKRLNPHNKKPQPSTLNPAQVPAHTIDKAVAVQELPVQSVIVTPLKGVSVSGVGGEVEVKGWAWSGGGRGIVRVDVTADGGKTWQTAELGQGSEQNMQRA